MTLPKKDNLTIHEVADFFRVHPKTIRNWMEEYPDFPKPFRRGMAMRFSRKEVVKYYRYSK